MDRSLRILLVWIFFLLAASLCMQGVLAIATTARSAQQVTTLEQHSLEPAVSLALLSLNLDQERALVTTDLAHMAPLRVQAVDDELMGLDDSITTAARRVLTPVASGYWQAAWPAYTSARARYMQAILAHRGQAAQAELGVQLENDLDTVLDIVQSDAGRHLYASQKLYRSAMLSDENAIRMIIIGFTMALAIGTILALLLMGRLNRGLRNLLCTAQAITTGSLDVRADETGRDELAELAAAYNHMTDALLSAERRADSDPLTGILNHRAFHRVLGEAITAAQTARDDLCVLMIDINNFKLFNDTYGHPVGDRVLQTFADLLRRECRTTDHVARYGGDEFALLAPNTTLAAGRQLAQRLLEASARTAIRVREHDNTLPLTLSIGVASAPHEAEAALGLMELADRRMFQSKTQGGGLNDASLTSPVLRLTPTAPFSVLDGLVVAIDNKDSYTRAHSEWVARFADMLAQSLGFSTEARQHLWMAALIHDVGKIGIPDHILRKPDRLTDDEYTVMKGHVVLSELIVTQVLRTPDIVDAVRYHHERWDGRGYPHRVAGTAIPIAGRIMILADAASAMYLSRPYRKGLSLEALVGELQRHRGTQFDPELTDLFIEALLAPSSPLLPAEPALEHAASGA